MKLCRICHLTKAHDYSVWPIAKQLALKLQNDPENYDRGLVNEMRGRDADAITKEEVEVFLLPWEGEDGE